MAGLSWQERTYNYSWMKSQSFDTDIYQDYNMEAGTNPSSPDTYYERWAMNSYFLRLAYTYKDRYSITATGRYDGSSKFGENNKYAFFPSAGLAWNVTQEDFLKNNNVLSNLKLHTSYGLTGNSEIGVYKSLATITSGTLLLNGTRSSYSKLGTLANSPVPHTTKTLVRAGDYRNPFTGVTLSPPSGFSRTTERIDARCFCADIQ